MKTQSFRSLVQSLSGSLAALSVCLFTQVAGAQPAAPMGTNSSGGGEAAIFNDEVVLARPIIKEKGHKIKFSDELIRELRRAGKLLVRYGAAYKPRYDLFGNESPDSLDRSAFIEDFVYPSSWMKAEKTLIEYRFVQELPNYPECHNRSRSESPFHAGEVTPIACTIKYVSWIREDLFLKMKMREQVKLLVHERLHSYGNPGLNEELFHEFIDDITEGLGLALQLYNDQIHGQRPVLTDEQVELLNTMVKRIAQLELNRGRKDGNDMPDMLIEKFYEKFSVTPNGGGLATSLTSKSAYIGVGSIAWADFGDNSELIDTSCYDPRVERFIMCELGRGAKMHFVTMYGQQPDKNLMVKLGDGAQMINVELEMMTQKNTKTSRIVELGAGAKMINAKIDDLWGIKLGDGAEIMKMRISYGLPVGLKHALTTQYPYEKLSENPALVLAAGARLSRDPKAEDSRHMLALFSSKWMGAKNPVLKVDGKIEVSYNICQSPANQIRLSGQETVRSLAELQKLCINQ